VQAAAIDEAAKARTGKKVELEEATATPGEEHS
jgi:hypothetical protein